MDDKLIIIIHVCEDYKDIAEVFFRLLNKCWNDCPYKIVVSYKSHLFKDYGFESYVSSSDSGLGNDVYEIMFKYQANYCISLLGDAFILKQIATNEIRDILSGLMKRRVDYCRLFHSGNKVKQLSKIDMNEIYGVSFIAFFASFNFVDSELREKTDLQFEKKYLRIAREEKAEESAGFSLFALPNSTFGIVHGVVKGLWLRDSYKKVREVIGKDCIGSRKRMSLHKYLWFEIKVYFRNHMMINGIHKWFSKIE